MERTKIESSICIATYNGALYIKEQIESILEQIDDSCEIIVVDDCSKDNTVSIIKSFNDERISVYLNTHNLGVNKSFEKAINLSCGEYIFLADQDDLWTEKRFLLMKEALKESLLVSGNTIAIDENGEVKEFELGSLASFHSKLHNRNIVNIFLGKAYYYGCAMAFRRKILDVILPFPNDLESHDLYIAMTANLMHSNCHIDEIVLKRRIHGKNASVVSRNIVLKIKSRFLFLKHLFLLKDRIRKIK